MLDKFFSSPLDDWFQGWRIDTGSNFQTVGLARHLEENGIGWIALSFAL